MRHPLPLPLPAMIGTPLRDALRGVSSFADVTEDVLEPAANYLPAPIRSTFRSALEALESAGTHILAAQIELEDIAVASDIVMGKHEGDAEICAAVIAFAWERLSHGIDDAPGMISETILTTRIGARAAIAGETPSQRAAGLMHDLRISNAIGRPPGFSRTREAKEQAGIDEVLTAVFVWLLAARSSTLDEEQNVLDLSAALIHAVRDDVMGAVESDDALGRLMQSLSAHL